MIHRRLHQLVFITLLVSQAATSRAQDAGLSPGAYRVGFESSLSYDMGRFFPGSDGRPVQLLAWYPAEEGGEPMAYADYVRTMLSEDALASGAIDADANEASWSRYYDHQGVDGKAVLSSPVTARRGADAATGSFPLLVYAPGAGGDAFENAAMMEYLASHGYVVAAVSSVGDRSFLMNTHDVKGAEAQAGDVAFAISRMRARPDVDRQRLGLIGWSWGALAAALVQMRNPDVDAVLSLDGSLPEHEKIAKRSPWYGTPSMRVPYLFVTAEDSASAAHMGDFLPRLRYATTYAFGYTTLRHIDFTTDYNYVISRALPDSADATLRKERYEEIARTALRFFDAYVKDQAPQSDLVDFSADVPEGVSYQVKAALPVPPSQEAFFDIVREEGISSARVAYDDVKARDPGYELFAEMDLVELAFELFNRRKRPDDAIATMQLGVDDRPYAYPSRGFLAELYRKNEDWKEALVNFSIAYGMALRMRAATSTPDEALREDLGWYRDQIQQLQQRVQAIR